MIPFQCTELFQENSPFVKELTSDALSMWKMFGGDKINATSHWLSKEDIPQSTIESFALNCGKFHCGEKFIGVEIWTQFREADYSLADTAKAGLSFHFDKDELQCKENDRWIFPALSTVTYLDASHAGQDSSIADPPGGAPLVIFNTTFEEDFSSQKESKRRKRRKLRAPALVKPSKCWATFPIPGRHVAFDGRLLHGVVSEILPLNALQKDSSSILQLKYSRLSLLVNIWTHHRPRHLLRCPCLTSTTQQNASLIPTSFSFFPTIRLPVAEQQKHLVAIQQQIVGSSILGSVKRQKRHIEQEENSTYRLQEHVVGDTALLPLAVFHHEFKSMLDIRRTPAFSEVQDKAKFGPKVIYIKYFD